LSKSRTRWRRLPGRLLAAAADNAPRPEVEALEAINVSTSKRRSTAALVWMTT
jgi:hypothetical protein